MTVLPPQGTLEGLLAPRGALGGLLLLLLLKVGSNPSIHPFTHL